MKNSVQIIKARPALLSVNNVFAFACSLIILISCSKSDNAVVPSATNVVYIESNDASSNSVIAYNRKTDGTLEALSGSPFLTGGKGVSNPMQILGPDDSDQQLVFSDDKKFLFAVNSGSNSIAVFNVASNGSLTPVSGSPFGSGGINPVSVAFANNYLFVVNKNQDPLQVNTEKPNYLSFKVGGDGSLSAVANSKVETIVGASPAHAYLSPDKKLLFGADFLAFMSTTVTGTLRSFVINADGTLAAAPNTPRVIDGMGGALGLDAHPTQNVLYVGFPLDGKVGVYSYDATGALTFKTSVAAGKAACWIRVNNAGTRLYVLNSAESTISVYDLTNPQSPSAIQKFEQRMPGPLFDSMSPAGMVTSSQPFTFEITDDGKNLYVINQHANPVFTSNYNYLHTISIDADGKLSEAADPAPIAVSAQTRPQGLVIY